MLKTRFDRISYYLFLKSNSMIWFGSPIVIHLFLCWNFRIQCQLLLELWLLQL